VFILAAQDARNPPGASDFSNGHLPEEGGRLAQRFNVAEYIERRNMTVVGVSYMKVGAGWMR
jgi:hypothetical protein